MWQQTTWIYKHFKNSNLKISLKTNNFLEDISVLKKKLYAQNVNQCLECCVCRSWLQQEVCGSVGEICVIGCVGYLLHSKIILSFQIGPNSTRKQLTRTKFAYFWKICYHPLATKRGDAATTQFHASIGLLRMQNNEIQAFHPSTANISSHQQWLNPLNAELNPICHLLVLLRAHHILHISRIRVKWTSCQIVQQPY